MRHKKVKLFSLIAIILVSVALAGCGVKVPGKNESVSGEKASSKKEDGKYTIAFIPKLVGFPYFTSMNEGAQKAAKEFGVNVIYQGSTTADVSEQSKIISGLIDQGVDAIGVAANSPTALNQLVSKAKQKGIMFYTTDSNVDSSDNSLFVQQASDKDLGYAMADSIAEQIGGAGDIALLSGGSTATNLNAWISFIKERLSANHPKIKIIDVRYAGEDTNASTQMAAQVIAANPGLKGFIGVSAANTPGIAEAVKQAGKTGKIAVTGIALPNVVKPYILSGVVKEAILWDPVKLGYLTVWGVLQELEGKQLAEENEVPGVGKVHYDSNTKTLLLGPPLIFDASNIKKYNF
ncbi:autoinducer 2 ABC transporter substrate-binding protein [Neobacillus pocheonensis]|uniref:autoinducer 2 ABC transporter substrate-binding protein n=1 Tax=Neobacillus pocheonensis TaxID=363869 RepID=UPI003D2CD5DD